MSLLSLLPPLRSPSVVVDVVVVLLVVGGVASLESGLYSNRTLRLIWPVNSVDCCIRVFVAIYVPEQYVTYASYACV